MKCTERKVRLSGEEVSFECDLLAVERNYGIVKYVIEHGRQVDGVYLPDGTVTLGLYYSDRDYNLYYWVAPKKGQNESTGRRPSDDPSTSSDGRSGVFPWDRDIAYYFNIAELLTLSHEEIAYRDFVVDVLILPDGRTSVLDESELPLNLDHALRSRINATRDELLSRHGQIIEEARSLLLPYARAL